MWLHVYEVDDGSVVGQKGGRQGQQRVFHPKALRGRLLKHKQHAFVLGHFFAKHQARLSLGLCLRHLRVDLMHTRLQLDAGQVGLWRVLG